ncbi:copper chaperone PCu(A)C [Micromonospora sp. NBC_01813]|uniref:copper chaperone PCu(A)C n=1 Tax=Micromonospora sp. NBC_01813 TaxID=2975988 RepID=UPI002DD9C762|nr:copper chaperone PCu(A)C [Micromonospora sp. NBC_01813]WSA11264.1 copper chaperone PCu(A)C [Micromonospora sp. NBC_01813]
MSTVLQPGPARRKAARIAVLSGIASVAVALAGCGDSGTPDASQPTPEASAGPSAAAAELVVQDPWVKAADDGMTAVFGVLVNDTTADVTITSVTTDISPVELHEMAMSDGAMVMREKDGGIVVPAGGSHTLEPGGDHIMLMDIARPVQPGDEIALTLTFADGATSEFTAVAKPFAGAEESYDPSTEMDHG